MKKINQKSFLYLIYIGIPIIYLISLLATYFLMLFANQYTNFATMIAIAILVVLLILVYTIFLTKRLSNLYSGKSRWLATIYLWFLSACLVVIIAVAPFITKAAMFYGHIINAPCIDASEELNSDGSYNLPKMTKSIEGILGSKNAIHPSRGDFISPVLTFKYPECVSGTFYSHEDEPEEIVSTITHIQLSLDEQEMTYYRKNKGNEVVVTGHFSRSNNANHTTHPFFFIVDDIRKSE